MIEKSRGALIWQPWHQRVNRAGWGVQIWTPAPVRNLGAVAVADALLGAADGLKRKEAMSYDFR